MIIALLFSLAVSSAHAQSQDAGLGYPCDQESIQNYAYLGQFEKQDACVKALYGEPNFEVPACPEGYEEGRLHDSLGFITVCTSPKEDVSMRTRWSERDDGKIIPYKVSVYKNGKRTERMRFHTFSGLELHEFKDEKGDTQFEIHYAGLGGYVDAPYARAESFYKDGQVANVQYYDKEGNLVKTMNKLDIAAAATEFFDTLDQDTTVPLRLSDKQTLQTKILKTELEIQYERLPSYQVNRLLSDCHTLGNEGVDDRKLGTYHYFNNETSICYFDSQRTPEFGSSDIITEDYTTYRNPVQPVLDSKTEFQWDDFIQPLRAKCMKDLRDRLIRQWGSGCKAPRMPNAIVLCEDCQSPHVITHLPDQALIEATPIESSTEQWTNDSRLILLLPISQMDPCSNQADQMIENLLSQVDSYATSNNLVPLDHQRMCEIIEDPHKVFEIMAPPKRCEQPESNPSDPTPEPLIGQSLQPFSFASIGIEKIKIQQPTANSIKEGVQDEPDLDKIDSLAFERLCNKMLGRGFKFVDGRTGKLPTCEEFEKQLQYWASGGIEVSPFGIFVDGRKIDSRFDLSCPGIQDESAELAESGFQLHKLKCYFAQNKFMEDRGLRPDISENAQENLYNYEIRFMMNMQKELAKSYQTEYWVQEMGPGEFPEIVDGKIRKALLPEECDIEVDEYDEEEGKYCIPSCAHRDKLLEISCNQEYLKNSYSTTYKEYNSDGTISIQYHPQIKAFDR